MTIERIKTTRVPKVWGNYCPERFPAEDSERRQVRTLVRARSQLRAVELLAAAGFTISRSIFSAEWKRSGDATELEATSEFTEGVWQEASGTGTERLFKELA